MIKDNVRYPFVITDGMGDILFVSPGGLISSDNIFSGGVFSREDVNFIRGELSVNAYERLFAIENMSDGNTVFVSSALYPSVGVIMYLYTDIPIKVAVALSEMTSVGVETRAEGRKVPGSVLEGYYPSFMKTISDIRLMLSPLDACDATDFSRFICERIGAISRLTFCFVDVGEKAIIPSSFNFDASLFSLFLILSFSCFSEISKSRNAYLEVSVKEGRPEYKVFLLSEDARKLTVSERKDIEKRFRALTLHMRAVCDRLNVPYSFVSLGDPTARIIPLRIEVSLLSLKTPIVPLDK